MRHLSLHFEEHGNSNDPLMVFLHGGGVSGWMWDKQVQYFSQCYCMTVDLPGHGRSSIEEKFSIVSAAEQVIDLVEAKANGKRIIVIGFSLGAQVLVQMLSMKPDLVDDAMIHSAAVRPNVLATQLIAPVLRATFPLVKNKTFSKWQAKALFIREADFERYYEDSLQLKRDTLTEVLKENMSFQIPKGFFQARGNILVSVGENELTSMHKSANDLVMNNHRCQGVIFAGIGHGMPLSHPDLFNQWTARWLSMMSNET